MTRNPNRSLGPLRTTTELSGEVIQKLREFVNAADLLVERPFSGTEWDALLAAVLKDLRFEDFKEGSLRQFILRELYPLEALNWGGSPEDKQALYEKIYGVVNSHPRDYRVVLEIPAMQTLEGYCIDFSRDVCIFTENGGYLPGQNSADELRTFLSVKAKGLLPTHGKGSAHDALEANFKHIQYFLGRDPRMSPGPYFGRPTFSIGGFKSEAQHPGFQ